jgi:hypothetical protein
MVEYLQLQGRNLSNEGGAMNRTIRGGLLVVLCLVVVAGLVLTGCGKKEKALQQPGLEYTQYIKGSTVDFDETTINTMSDSGGEGGFKYGLMKSVYPTLWASWTDNVAQTLFGVPYWRGDGVHTYYSYLTSADQTAVDGTIFATKLSAAEQQAVVTAVDGFFARQEIDVSNAKALTATSFYLTLQSGVGQAAADGWVADIEATVGSLYAGKVYADLAAADKQVVIAVADPAGLFYKWLAGNAVYGEGAFRGGVVARMYPTLAETNAQAMYSKAYSALDAVTQAPYVNGAVYASLASYYADDVARATARAGMAYYFKSLGYVTSDNYSALNYVEKARVDQAVSASIPSGKAKERDYIDFSAIPGAVLNFVAEMGDAVPMEQSICYLALSRTTVTSAKNFKAAVEAGTLLRQAFYRWLAKEKVMETASAASLIQQSVGEFYFTITNPNKYEIKIDQIVFAFRTTVGASNMVIDGARQTVDSIYVPADGEVSLKVVAPTKVYDLLSWLTIAGQGANARAYAAQVWSNIQAGTITWTFTAEMKVSHGDEIENYSYPV